MFEPIVNKTGYSKAYLESRRRIDDLCRSIMLGEISPKETLDRYESIETRYLKETSEKAELFRMVYRSRIERLVNQFGPGICDEP